MVLRGLDEEHGMLAECFGMRHFFFVSGSHFFGRNAGYG